MRRNALDRRSVLKMTAAGVAGVTLAGCTSDGGSGGDGSGGSGESGGSDDESGGDASGEESGGDSGGSESYDFGGWFDNTDNFDGVVDETGSDEVTVSVGAEGNGDAFGFGPAAVAVSPGTTVVWEWTGNGGMHDVVADGGEFESDQTSEAGHTFEHTFEETGTFEYYCTPHEPMGMKGAIVVE